MKTKLGRNEGDAQVGAHGFPQNTPAVRMKAGGNVDTDDFRSGIIHRTDRRTIGLSHFLIKTDAKYRVHNKVRVLEGLGKVGPAELCARNAQLQYNFII